jgi:anti-anti-sigma factor
VRRHEVPEDARPYAFRLERSPAEVTVWASGELDLAASEELRAVLVAAASRHRRVVFDVGEVEFIDGACLGAIVAAKKEAGPEVDLILRRPTHIVNRVLRLTGLYESLQIEP